MLAKVMPALPRLRVTRFDAPLQVGSAIHLELALGPIRQPWELTVIVVAAGRQFVDQQTGRGPMAYWRHTHAFEAAGDGTRVIDHIEYALPLGALGRVAAALFGGLAMWALFAVRRRKTYGPILAFSDILYTIPSLALFAVLVAITGISTIIRKIHKGC